MKPSVRSAGAIAAMVLAGCSDLSGLGGTDHYACKAPEGVRCDSLAGNYANSLANNLPGQNASLGGARRALTPLRPVQAAPFPASMTGGPADLRALRSDERLLRLWVKRWRDRDNDLVDESFIYMKVESGHWMLDAAQERGTKGYRVVEAPRSSAPAVAPPAALPALSGSGDLPGASAAPTPSAAPVDGAGLPPLAPELPGQQPPAMPAPATVGEH